MCCASFDFIYCGYIIIYIPMILYIDYTKHVWGANMCINDLMYDESPGLLKDNV